VSREFSGRDAASVTSSGSATSPVDLWQRRKSKPLSKEGFTAIRVDDEPTRQRIYQFRVEVWRETSEALAADAFPEGMWQDRHDASSFHWAVLDPAGELVAAARLSLHDSLGDVSEAFQYERYGLAYDGLIAAPDRVVVNPRARRQGLARHLLDCQDALSVSKGASCAVRQASPGMCRLLMQRGWELMGPALPDPRFPGIQFTVAIKKIVW